MICKRFFDTHPFRKPKYKFALHYDRFTFKKLSDDEIKELAEKHNLTQEDLDDYIEAYASNEKVEPELSDDYKWRFFITKSQIKEFEEINENKIPEVRLSQITVDFIRDIVFDRLCYLIDLYNKRGWVKELDDVYDALCAKKMFNKVPDFVKLRWEDRDNGKISLEEWRNVELV